MKSLIKKFVPKSFLSAYHFLLAVAVSVWYGFPSRRMIIIGVTGTKGKTTTANFIWSVCEASGYATGLVSSSVIRIGKRQMLNPFHMTMPSPFIMQKFLRMMADEGCLCAVIETTSEGLVKWRHIGIRYDLAVFTNLSPEHIESHGSFEAYKIAKGRLFRTLIRHKQKTINGEKVPRISIINNDSEHSDFFKKFPTDRIATFGLTQGADYVAQDVKGTNAGVSFRVGVHQYKINLAGEFNVMNALPAVAIGEILDISPAAIQAGFDSLKLVPGRMEVINEGQDFTVIVDYAHEKLSMGALLDAAENFITKSAVKDKKIIILLGAEGGGRDKAKRPLMGDLVGRGADYVFVSNVDPYDDDPKEIIEDIVVAAERAGKVRDKNVFAIEDRREGIRAALHCAKRGDLVLVTGKGAEQSMIIKGNELPWDDRIVVREELQEILGKK